MLIMRYAPIKQRGFSLVELSIVLVILGLLTGGILAGQSLIRAAQLRSVTTEYQRYVTATLAFRDKYFALPGDMPNATMVWGKDNTNCSGNTGTAATPGTCNGNGNGLVELAAAINSTGEIFQFWKQLTLAGLLEGSYTGLAGPSTIWPGYDHVIGSNVPQSKMNNGGWATQTTGVYAGFAGLLYAGDYGNQLTIGAALTGFPAVNPLLKPEEAWNIDTKLDDGKPGTGKILARFMTNTCTTGSSTTDYASTYNLSDSNVECALYFVRAF